MGICYIGCADAENALNRAEYIQVTTAMEFGLKTDGTESEGCKVAHAGGQKGKNWKTSKKQQENVFTWGAWGA